MFVACVAHCFNPLWPSHGIWGYMARVKACCLMAECLYLLTYHTCDPLTSIWGQFRKPFDITNPKFIQIWGQWVDKHYVNHVNLKSTSTQIFMGINYWPSKCLQHHSAVLTFLVLKPEYSGRTMLCWFLIPWILVLLGHQKPRCLLRIIKKSLPS